MSNVESASQPAKRAYRVKEAMQAFGVGKTSLYALMKDGRLPAVKVNGMRLIPADALEKLFATKNA